MKIKPVKIGNKLVGPDEPCFVVAEIGINHNGNIDLAKKLITASSFAGADAVKFQKRTIEIVYSKEELLKPRENPFGDTNGDLKRGLEFNSNQYNLINEHCDLNNIVWFASCWDEKSVDFIENFNPPCYKIASASLTDRKLLQHHRETKKPIILSTGMSTLKEIDMAVDTLGTNNLIILHATSSYPCEIKELNLKMIKTLEERYNVPIGYSGHEVGIPTTVAAAAIGACMIERHITLDRSMWGSDQAASVEPIGFSKICDSVKVINKALGDGVKVVYDSEKPIIEKLRRIK